MQMTSVADVKPLFKGYYVNVKKGKVDFERASKEEERLKELYPNTNRFLFCSRTSISIDNVIVSIIANIA